MKMSAIRASSWQELEVTKDRTITLFDGNQSCIHCHTFTSKVEFGSKGHFSTLKTCILPHGLFIWTNHPTIGESSFVSTIICLDCIPREEV